jgi:hypothetical protein
MIDIDDLGENDFLIACFEDQLEDNYTVYIWKGTSIQIDSDEYNEYLTRIKQNFFSEDDIEKVIVLEETPYNESEEFLGLL